MKWFHGFLLLLSIFFGSFFINQINVFAVSDLSVTFNAGSTVSSSGTLLFPNCDLTCYQDYNYLIVEPVNSSFPASFQASPFYLRVRSTTYLQSMNFQFYYYAVYDISSFYDLSFRGDWGEVPITVTFTLSETFPAGDCPVCEVCQECPVIPENPYDNKLDNIVQAIYVCAATLLVLYFFYCIYRLIIRNSGVK